MKRRRHGLFAVLLSLPAFVFTSFAQQSAKELRDQGMTAADQCSALKLVCRAAGLDKKYSKECEEFKFSSNRNFTTGYEKLDAKLYPSAAHYANNVCDYDPALSAKKQQLLDSIQKAQASGSNLVAAIRPEQEPPPPPPQEPAAKDVSGRKLIEANKAFDSGNLDAAAAAAGQITDKNLQASANYMLQRISRYKGAILDAQQREANKDLPGALVSYHIALSYSARGPGNPGGHIRALEAELHPTTTSQTGGVTGTKPPGSVTKPTDFRVVEADRLLAEGKKAEAGNLLQYALKSYRAAQHLQPANPEISAAVTRVQGAINSKPEEQAKVLADAIRAFYHGSYPDAEDGFTSYLSSPTAQYRGAAYFYLGATRLYRAILELSGRRQDAVNSPQVQRPFKDARTACYQPVSKYLAPIVSDAWNASAESSACQR